MSSHRRPEAETGSSPANPEPGAAERLRGLLGADSPQGTAGSCAARLRLALDLADSGLDMMHQNLRRRFPAEGEEEIERRLAARLLERPGAEFGDAAGRPAPERFENP